MLAQSPVQIPVYVDPTRTTKDRPCRECRIEARFVRSHAGNWEGKPKLSFVEQVFIHQLANNVRIHFFQDQRKKATASKYFFRLLVRTAQVPKGALLLDRKSTRLNSS